MEKKINKKLLIYILLFLSLSLISVYIIEYVLGNKPCKLCIYERIPYFLAILLLIKLVFFARYEKTILIILSLLFITSFILAFYHLGIEQGFFEESNACKAVDLSKDLSKEELLLKLKQKTISCKEVTFKIFGLSLATINTIFSVILSVIFTKLFINYGKN